MCQLYNLFHPKTHRTYSIGTIVIISLKYQLNSPACYDYLKSLDSLSLQYYATLQRLYTIFGLDSEYNGVAMTRGDASTPPLGDGPMHWRGKPGIPTTRITTTRITTTGSGQLATPTTRITTTRI